jgi:hypothetical protein
MLRLVLRPPFYGGGRELPLIQRFAKIVFFGKIVHFGGNRGGHRGGHRGANGLGRFEDEAH